MSVQIAVIDGAYRVYRTTNGRDRDYIGPKWVTPKAAARYADLIDQPYTSPLHASGEATTPVPVPPPGPGQSVASSEPPSATLGL